MEALKKLMFLMIFLILGSGSKSFTPSELAELNYNLDQCGFPKEEEEILNPFELIQNYQAERATLNHKIDNVLADILQLLEDK
ncbi:type I restriction-modification system M protein [Streptococcus pneumoniae]|nr:type I restriction-modification system M protein [Streptococcus pneumoniae]